jgi:hypothetical protein
MTCSAYEKVQINHAHAEAICREVGQRLGALFDQNPVPMSPQLTTLMRRLRDEH